ncbi:threonine-rich protein-like [Sabethes cyaneus]|uniref:threonine-rich protein-like n=1 Tax=Sabethes cyaneus TaxID=53552 RepID=UPI00237EBC27|nr:threonine-rich protein-like [Sabethes cyaneus]
MKQSKTLLLVIATLVVCLAEAIEKCPNQYDPAHPVYFPHEDCTRYYVCGVEGATIEQSCAPGLHWNQQMEYCDYPEQAECDSTEETTTVEVTTASTTDLPTTSTNGPSTTTTKSTTTTVEPLTTTSAPSTTTTGSSTTSEEPSTTSTESSTVTSVPSTTTTGSSTTTEEPSTTSTEPPTTSTEPPTTATGTSTTVSSPLTTTTESTTTSTTASSTEASTSGQPPVCPPQENDNAYFPHESDCTKYYLCSHGVAIEMSCAEGTFWNAEANVCDIPGHSGCVPSLIESRNGTCRIKSSSPLHSALDYSSTIRRASSRHTQVGFNLVEPSRTLSSSIPSAGGVLEENGFHWTVVQHPCDVADPL